MIKHIIFDLDETIGYFSQFIFIINIIQSYMPIDYNIQFNNFISFFRPGIFDVFKELIYKKRTGKIQCVILYSNNNNIVFVNRVIDFIHYKIDYELFDDIITLEDPRRRTRNKEYYDLVHCIPHIQNGRLCFIDDRKHRLMLHENVDYIKCEKYICELKIDKIMNILNQYPLNHSHIYQQLKTYRLSNKKLPIQVHSISTNKMLEKIEIFIQNISLING